MDEREGEESDKGDFIKYVWNKGGGGKNCLFQKTNSIGNAVKGRGV